MVTRRQLLRHAASGIALSAFSRLPAAYPLTQPSCEELRCPQSYLPPEPATTTQQYSSRSELQEATAEFNRMPFCSRLSDFSSNVFEFHNEWHRRTDRPKSLPDFGAFDPCWGMKGMFGVDFLSMHASMLRLYLSWLAMKQLVVPRVFRDWQPADGAPYELRYVPDEGDFSTGNQPWEWSLYRKKCNLEITHLRRKIPSPRFSIPNVFKLRSDSTREVMETREANTGFTALEEIRNRTQLGNLLSLQHDLWHVCLIDGAMGHFNLAPADPLFYLGVHDIIEKIHQDWLTTRPSMPMPSQIDTCDGSSCFDERPGCAQAPCEQPWAGLRAEPQREAMQQQIHASQVLRLRLDHAS